MVLMSELIVFSAAYPMVFAGYAIVCYGITCTHRNEVNKAAPVEVSSAVAYAVAAPPQEVPVATVGVPDQVPITTEESGVASCYFESPNPGANHPTGVRRSSSS